ncbi:cobalt-precorrin 5A hydrolase [Oribacterium sp. P6A1]|uniref:cobalt-precorrin 5A hydrolase n=1 Tax=Oribacterium sp. P6A1 TaxID=1410612 RepID=UPI00068F3658|nr:cobalamin biosynthesis protein [Oribacterium sp. P6A1]
MRVEIIAFTEKGYKLGKSIMERCLGNGVPGEISGMIGDSKWDIGLYAKTKALPEISDPRELNELMSLWFGRSENEAAGSSDTASMKDDPVRERDKASAIIFIGSTGIAVRAIAPFIKHKSEDPAVMVIDEAGHFVISLLSGHLGGANELTDYISKLISAEPVITTASDIEGAFSVDVFAKENGFIISDFGKAKEAQAKVLRGEKLRIYSDIGMENLRKRPGIAEAEMLSSKEIDKADIVISYRTKYLQYEEPVIRPFDAIGLRLTAKRIYVGIGARKGVSEEDVMKAYDNCLKSSGIDPSSVAALVSIDIKKNEQGILTFSYKREIPFITYTPEELSSLEGDFAASAFVQSVTGVSNVCERAAAYAASRNGCEKVLVHKQIYGNVTLAIAVAM